jgi:hypothetical protein
MEAEMRFSRAAGAAIVTAARVRVMKDFMFTVGRWVVLGLDVDIDWKIE